MGRNQFMSVIIRQRLKILAIINNAQKFIYTYMQATGMVSDHIVDCFCKNIK
ncbi:hypothetical protein FUSO4_11250 [Fusobacterium necrophorum DJ-1]|uniref:DNA-3-methyladenine glycosylase I n=2 Tax=Fusobacterium necrophorum TaxID=859 RepID=A0AB73C173_9FUSO|nr:hypothetical protein FUSO4_11250 [Fusobacterium necrophorum DJ-1]KDE70264.1 hypothetical protein FUSO8_09445 [Fusobacterium necrophorum DJ-2]